ncbi:MAG: response regulator transcription factor [Ferruginibacter sp.]|nr:response regulator transcription factor [Ferruginibacter sp.]
MPGKQIMRLVLVDDHRLFRKGLISLIEMVCTDCNILFEADNGVDLQQKLIKGNEPDIILMDVNMPQMDGFATVQWLNENYPLIKILVVSMIEKEESIVRMLQLGVKGYLSKDVEPKELGEALNAVMNKGFYYTDFITGKLVHSLQNDNDSNKKTSAAIQSMNNREMNFLQLACSELTYSEIAAQMFLSPKTIDGYRNSLFEKLQVKSRVGMALYAVRHGLVQL